MAAYLKRTATAVAVLSGSALGGFATEVVSYDPGSATTTNPGTTVPGSALGAPAGLIGESFGFPNVLSPFSPAFEGNDIVVIGDGGQLTLKLAKLVSVGDGREIGVISNVGLIDLDYPNGNASSPATKFGGGSAEVKVSGDGVEFVSLGTVDFNAPAAYFTNAGQYDTSVPAAPEVSDFDKPFDGDLQSFAGQTFAQVLATLDGSIGGTWIDLSPSGLTDVQFIQFLVPDDGDPGSKLAIDAITSIASDGGTEPPPPAVPLPGAVVMGLLAAPLVLRATRRRKD
jgi:hypothetical protein